jgi:hypothetical protein
MNSGAVLAGGLAGAVSLVCLRASFQASRKSGSAETIPEVAATDTSSTVLEDEAAKAASTVDDASKTSGEMGHCNPFLRQVGFGRKVSFQI